MALKINGQHPADYWLDQLQAEANGIPDLFLVHGNHRPTAFYRPLAYNIATRTVMKEEGATVPFAVENLTLKVNKLLSLKPYQLARRFVAAHSRGSGHALNAKGAS